MADVPDKYFDLCICDPPYGINAAKRNGSIGQKKGQGRITCYKSKDWDSAIPNKKYFDELFRISKNQIIWGANYFVKFLPASMGWVVYDKLQPEGVTFAMAELAFTSFNKSVKTFKTSRGNMQNCVSNNEIIGKSNAKINPCQKPVQLYKWLLKNYAKPTDKILDTHGGSGSIAIAVWEANQSLEMNLTLDWCEIDKEYYDAALLRYKNHISQLKLL